MSPGVQAAFLVASIVGVAGVIRWWNTQTPQPDPWDAEVEAEIQNSEALPVCHRCLEPQEAHRWFCAKCGASIGTYNNLDPYAQIFAEAEVLRNGTTRPMQQRPLVVAGYFLLGLIAYSVFAPIYWVVLIRNLRSHPAVPQGEPASSPADTGSAESEPM